MILLKITNDYPQKDQIYRGQLPSSGKIFQKTDIQMSYHTMIQGNAFHWSITVIRPNATQKRPLN